MADRKPTALAGDCFAGLFTLGVSWAGFDVIGDLEHSGYGSKTHALNFPDVPIRIGVDRWQPADFTNKVDFMYCNPPCAAWSSMRVGGGGNGPSQSWRDQGDRLQYVRNLTHAGLTIRPKTWAWESVTNAWRHGRDFVMEVAELWANNGYDVTILLQNNKYLGGNQHRPRIFVIAHRYPLVWEPFVKPPTFRQLMKQVPKRRPKSPVKEPELAPSLKKLWEMAPHYGYVLRRALLTRTEAELKTLRPRPAMTVNRVKPDQTPGVFIGASKRLHPDEPRNINWHEVLAVCGLPMDWQTSQTSLEPASLECSRAVMPGVGRWLALSIKTGLAQRPLKGPATVRVVDLQDPERPTTEVLLTVPRFNAPPAVWTPPVTAAAPKARVGTPRAPREPGTAAPRRGSGYRIRELLCEGRPTEAILATIRAEFPESKAGPSDVAWNRAKLRQQGGNP